MALDTKRTHNRVPHWAFVTVTLQWKCKDKGEYIPRDIHCYFSIQERPDAHKIHEPLFQVLAKNKTIKLVEGFHRYQKITDL